MSENRENEIGVLARAIYDDVCREMPAHRKYAEALIAAREALNEAIPHYCDYHCTPYEGEPMRHTARCVEMTAVLSNLWALSK